MGVTLREAVNVSDTVALGDSVGVKLGCKERDLVTSLERLKDPDSDNVGEGLIVTVTLPDMVGVGLSVAVGDCV